MTLIHLDVLPERVALTRVARPALKGPRYSAAAIRWMERVLGERFSRHLRLQHIDSDYIDIRVAGSALRIRMPAQAEMFTQASSDLAVTSWDGAAEGWNMPLTRPLPAPGASRLPYPLIRQDAKGVTIDYAILGLMYWMLTRQEEVGRADTDRHGRFASTSSHAYQHGYLERPIVDEWLDVLGQVMKKTWPKIGHVSHSYSMRVSHDVDWPSRYGFTSAKILPRQIIGDFITTRNWTHMLKAPLIWAGTHSKLLRLDPFNTFDWIMEQSERYGLTSAFYFLCGRTDPNRDAHYDVDHPAIRALMRRIHERGHEIGLHPSYRTFRNKSALGAEAETLKRICDEEGIRQRGWGGRMHILRWETPTTMLAWEEADMTYDSTLSYADRPGFRCGTCHEYPGFDPVEQRALSLRIRPLIVMECTVMAPRYMALGTGQEALEKILQLKEACRGVKGCFTLLWHNSELETAEKRDLYKNVLAKSCPRDC